jgi:hypothetical protein
MTRLSLVFNSKTGMAEQMHKSRCSPQPVQGFFVLRCLENGNVFFDRSMENSYYSQNGGMAKNIFNKLLILLSSIR